MRCCALLYLCCIPALPCRSIANFTDVAATFKGIIQAFREKADALKAAQFKIFCRRGARSAQGWHSIDASGAVHGIAHRTPCSVHLAWRMC